VYFCTAIDGYDRGRPTARLDANHAKLLMQAL